MLHAILFQWKLLLPLCLSFKERRHYSVIETVYLSNTNNTIGSNLFKIYRNMESSSSDEECNAMLYSKKYIVEDEPFEETSKKSNNFLERFQGNELTDKAEDYHSDNSNINKPIENDGECNEKLLSKEDDNENSEVLPKEIDDLRDKTDGNQSDIGNINQSMGDANDSHVKFLSSEFFDKFVCQPSTSKENTGIINKNESKKEEETEKTCESNEKPNLEAETNNMSTGCKLRINVNKQEDKNSDSKDSSINSPTQHIPFSGFGSYSTPFNFIQPEKKTYNSSEEYFSDLRLWLQQAFFWQSVTASFPYFLMCQQFGQMTNNNQQAPPGLNFPSQFPFFFPQFQNMSQPTSMPSSTSVPNHQASQRQPVTDGVECRIPSFWKRIAAEFIDFIILFFWKIAVTYIAIDFFHLVDLDQLDLINKDSKLAYKQFMQLTQEIVILELIHRLAVCIFETYWLRGGLNGQIGGATPGKSIMGLRVIQCETSVFIRENEGVVIVKPGTNLSLTTAFFRSITKNFVLALLVPTSFAFIFFPHNRTGYDMICSTIVVEDPIIPHRVNEL